MITGPARAPAMSANLLAGLLAGLTALTGIGLAGCGQHPSAPPPSGPVHLGSVSQVVTVRGSLSGVDSQGPGNAVVGPIGASDGVLIKPGQPAVAHFDAIPGLTLNGTVQRVSTVAVQATGFTDYFVTVGLTQGDPRLRSGQTAAAEVVVGRLDNVLVVPNSAVSDQDGKSWVTVDGPDGAARRVAFQAGVVGDDTTQVLGGLTEGQQVELAAG